MILVESSEEIPLNNSKKKQNQSNDYDSVADEAEKQLLNVRSNRLLNTNKLKKNGKIEPASLVDSATSTLLDAECSTTNLHDINAMSIASIYDREDDDVMDADK